MKRLWLEFRRHMALRAMRKALRWTPKTDVRSLMVMREYLFAMNEIDRTSDAKGF